MAYRRLIAFDADFTLIKYEPRALSKFLYTAVAQRMVGLGFPSALLAPRYTEEMHLTVESGLTADFQTGYLLKLDETQTICKAYLGFDPVSSASLTRYNFAEAHRKVVPGRWATCASNFDHRLTHAFRSCVDLVSLGELPISYLRIWEGIEKADRMVYQDPDSFRLLFADLPHYVRRWPEKVKETLAQLRTEDTAIGLFSNSTEAYVDLNSLCHK